MLIDEYDTPIQTGFLKGYYDEIVGFFKTFKLEVTFDKVEQWYDGYKIGNTTIFNPWSLLNYTDSRGTFDVYWANTSSNDIIRILVENSDGFQDDLKYLLKGQTVERVINPNITFKDKDFNFNEEML